ncbi:hypothetical protein M422DRAFT_50623 [Sphaerobolus stellatus SS14]|uniref:Unplaced genomic scaffold SPHSTscaffold_96, whole genome shotgun sequence n=1 Tax=Sphaerobolus stellatus (strain SS14) TaxID=990650 RepID=A0A0C9V6F6_SPHS4|nr:hypothetical protein M422DRAFT_50623 [Sphaerobolus stellatus SS14]
MLVNQMIEQEMEVPVNACMTLLYGTKHHHPEHVRQICKVLTGRGNLGLMNDTTFTSLLYCFVRAGYPLERIKAITKKYVGRQTKGWVPGPGFFTPLIQSYTAHGDVKEASAALQKYRSTLTKAKVVYRYRTLRKSYARLHRDFFRGWLAKSQLNVPKPNIEKPRRSIRPATPLSAPYTAYLELFQKRGCAGGAAGKHAIVIGRPHAVDEDRRDRPRHPFLQQSDSSAHCAGLWTSSTREEG